MKRILFTLAFATSFSAFSQKNYFQSESGNIFDKKGFDKEKQIKLKEVQKQFGNDYDIEEELNLKSSSKDSIIYTFNLTMLPKELKLEKERLNKFKNKKFSFTNLEFINSEYKDKLDLKKPTFINFWFTRCPPCIEEMPALNELKEKYNDRVNFISITFDSKEQVLKFLTKHNFKFSHIVNQQKLIDSYGISGYPKSFLLDKNQNIIFIEEGLPGKDNEKVYQLLMSKMEDKINKLL